MSAHADLSQRAECCHRGQQRGASYLQLLGPAGQPQPRRDVQKYDQVQTCHE